MATAARAETRAQVTKPQLVFFSSPRSGHSRRVEGFLAQVLQRRRNHGTFRLRIVDGEQHPELVERFQLAGLPALVVIESGRVRAWLEHPRGCREIEQLLAPWLR